LHRHLHRLMEHNYRSEILQVLCRSKEFLEVMDPLTICKQLSILSDQHQRIFQSIQQIVPGKGAQLANKHILRSLPELGRETLFDFLHAVTVCGTEGERLVEQMIPNFQQLYRTVYFVGVNTTVRDVLDSCAKSGEACPFEVDISYQTFPPSEPQKIIDDVLEDIYDEDEIPLRHYQEELAEAAYNGQNTVVCAPTGSGKTVVAASVIRKHLLQGLVAKKRNKVCFLVSNTTFLEQQAELLRRFLRKRFKIIALSGATSAEAPRLLTIVDNDVVVITPQLIVNLIKAQNTEEDCVRFSLTMFSLLIFDEAHHTSESHPYNVQVVGLTASLGVGKAKSEEEAREHILRMCANLDADVLSRVRRYESELREFSRIATDETILVMSSHNNTPFFHAIIELMGKFEEMFAEGSFCECSSER
uniref:Dicer-related helicase (inferred by orthology to a C. elegans protein) n=1 Tax=Anisakis simplex TaxID=6269 RepID=A0A0M3KC93_ANISI